MSEDPQNIVNIAPLEGDKIVDANDAISSPQKRASNPTIVGAKDVRKVGIKTVTKRDK